MRSRSTPSAMLFAAEMEHLLDWLRTEADAQQVRPRTQTRQWIEQRRDAGAGI